MDEFVWSTRPRTAPAYGTTRTGASRAWSREARLAERPLARSVIYTRIVPSLLSVLEQTEDTSIIDAAAISLGCMVEAPFGSPVIASVEPLLGHHELAVQIASILSLGLLGSHEATGPLVDVAACSRRGHELVGASEVPRQVRAVAALSLGLLNDARAIPTLMQMVDKLDDADGRVCAILALGLMSNEDSPHAADFLLSRLGDRKLDAAVQSAIPVALGRMGHTAGVDTLLDVMQARDTDSRVQQSAAIALGRLTDMERTDVVAALMDLAEEGRDAPARHFAIMSLARIGSRNADAALDLHEQLVTFLARQVSHPRRAMDRPWAALAAGVYGRSQTHAHSRLTDRLLAAYDDVKDPATRGAFAIGLGLLGAREAGPRLKDDFRDTKDEDFRGHAALALGLMSYREADGDLRDTLTETGIGQGLQHAVTLGLGLMEDSRTPRTLSESFLAAGNLSRRAGLAQALGALRDAQGADPLQQAVSDPTLDDQSRASACAALGRLAEKTVRPWRSSLSIDSNFVVEQATLDAILALP